MLFNRKTRFFNLMVTFYFKQHQYVFDMTVLNIKMCILVSFRQGSPGTHY